MVLGASRADCLGSFYCSCRNVCKKNIVDLTNNDCSSSSKPPTSNSHIVQSTTKPTEKQPGKAIASTLNTNQTNVASQIFSGSNAVLTGAAGVDKSYLLNYLIEGLKAGHGQDCVLESACDRDCCDSHRKHRLRDDLFVGSRENGRGRCRVKYHSEEVSLVQVIMMLCSC